MKQSLVWVKVAGLSLLLLLVMIFAISVGSADLSMWDSLQMVLAKGQVACDTAVYFIHHSKSRMISFATR